MQQINYATVQSLDGQRLLLDTCASAKALLENNVFYDVEEGRLFRAVLVEINYHSFRTRDEGEAKGGESIAMVVVWLLDPYSADALRDGGHLLLNCLQQDLTIIRAQCDPMDPVSFDSARETIPWKDGTHEAQNIDESWRTDPSLLLPSTRPAVVVGADNSAGGGARAASKKKKKKAKKSSVKADRAEPDGESTGDEEEEAVEYKGRTVKKARFGAPGSSVQDDQLSYDHLQMFLEAIPDGKVKSNNGKWLVRQLLALAKSTQRWGGTLQDSIAGLMEGYCSWREWRFIYRDELGWDFFPEGGRNATYAQVAHAFILWVNSFGVAGGA